MSEIRILPDEISNKIAAGEVIERPASIVKELIENSIDAKAKYISVSIEKAGRKLISVLDDGYGMDADDALLCFEPHATSKIKNKEDIKNIVTMGFRGEALPSIATVSRLTLKTKKTEALEGSQIIIEGGQIRSEKPTGCANGTQINVKDLFYNTPARKKFLKKDETEEKHIYETIFLLALANPAISFDFTIDGKRVFSIPAENDILARIASVLGKNIVNSSLKVEYENKKIKVHGYISKPNLVRNTRREQRIFINKRPIKSPLIYSAISEAYRSIIMKGYHTIVTLFIELSPSLVDVNVHPTKYEARFINENEVKRNIVHALRIPLEKSMEPVSSLPKANTNLNLETVLKGSEVKYSLKNDENSKVERELDLGKTTDASFKKNHDKLEKKEFPDSFEKFSIGKNATSKTDFGQNINKTEGNNEFNLKLPGNYDINIVGFLDETYILCSSKEGLLVIDQHAAHERILFEKLLDKENSENLSQKLLIPITINLSYQEFNFIRKYSYKLNNLGFEIDIFGEKTIIVTSVPQGFPMENISSVISDLINELLEGISNRQEINKDLIASTACKFAVKSHEALNNLEARTLIKNLSNCKLPYSCPHGRPTVIQITYSELEKRFGRK